MKNKPIFDKKTWRAEKLDMVAVELKELICSYPIPANRTKEEKRQVGNIRKAFYIIFDLKIV